MAIRGNVYYFDLCKVVKQVNIAFNAIRTFRVDYVTKFLLEFQMAHIKGTRSKMSYDFEILNIFLKQNNIVANWIDCYGVYGYFDEESGQWTGEIGKVCLMMILDYVFHFSTLGREW